MVVRVAKQARAAARADWPWGNSMRALFQESSQHLARGVRARSFGAHSASSFISLIRKVQ